MKKLLINVNDPIMSISTVVGIAQWDSVFTQIFPGLSPTDVIDRALDSASLRGCQ